MKQFSTPKTYKRPLCAVLDAQWASLLCDSDNESSGSTESYDNIGDFSW